MHKVSYRAVTNLGAERLKTGGSALLIVIGPLIISSP